MHSARQQESLEILKGFFRLRVLFNFCSQKKLFKSQTDPLTVDIWGYPTNILTVLVIAGCESHRWWIFMGGRKSVK